MDDLDKYLADLRGLRGGMLGAIPEFSDKDGRTTAEVLFLFEDPGKSGAAESGVVDRDNDDSSAAAFLSSILFHPPRLLDYKSPLFCSAHAMHSAFNVRGRLT
jgi:hypothetical protein